MSSPMPISDSTIGKIQKRIARSCISASTFRNSKKGTMRKVQGFLGNIELKRLQAAGNTTFAEQHKKIVTELQGELKAVSCSCEYGLCVKAVNLFLRDVVTNYYTRVTYDLGNLEKHLQIPIDSKVYKKLYQQRKPNALPKWCGIARMPEELHTKCQLIAQFIADDKQELRIHLDDDFWSGET